MGRIHLFELNDQSWFPRFLRDYMTDFLQFGANQFNAYKDIDYLLEKGIQKASHPRVVDLGSGGGGGWLRLAGRLNARNPDLKITLTDLHPNQKAFQRSQNILPGVFESMDEPVDARSVPKALKGLRTMFLSFHHFRPADAQSILQGAVDAKEPVAIFELQKRDIPSLIPMLFSPLTLFLTTPFIRPFTLWRLVFTYLIPVLPLAIVWDGVISVLRTYKQRELREMTGRLAGGADYEWEIGLTKKGPAGVLYLLGYPK